MPNKVGLTDFHAPAAAFPCICSPLARVALLLQFAPGHRDFAARRRRVRSLLLTSTPQNQVNQPWDLIATSSLYFEGFFNAS